MAKESEKKEARVRVAYTPLSSDAPKRVAEREFVRAEAEDDDGYDPYSDRREERPFFEANPWD